MKTKASILNLGLIKPQLKSKIRILCEPTSSVKDEHLEKYLPEYNDKIQLIEVRRQRVLELDDKSALKCLDGSFICLRDVRPELFIRRDFINNFVLQGEILIIHESGDTYQLCTKNNVLSITLDRFHYNRFGLIGKKVRSDKRTRQRQEEYQVDIDLKDERILQSNKWQDKLVIALQRLPSIKRVFVRWLGNKRKVSDSSSESSKVILDFFRNVNEEYKKDGFKPVPLSDCYQINQKVERKWINKSQLHPSLEMNNFAKRQRRQFPPSSSGNAMGREKNCNQLVTSSNNDELERMVADIVDWLGLQLLSVDCNQVGICTDKFILPEDQMTNRESIERYDVNCTQLSGVYDHKIIGIFLRNLFRRDKRQKADSIMFRALFLYNSSCSTKEQDSDVATLIMQDCFVSSRADEADEDKNLITLISLRG